MTSLERLAQTPQGPSAPPAALKSAPRSPARRLGSLLALIAIAAAGGFVGSQLGQSAGIGVRREAISAWFFVGLVAVMWGTIAVHEMGHLLAGLWQGNRFAIFAVGPLLVVRDGERIRVRFNRSASLWGGIAGTMPPPGGDTRDVITNFRRVVIAGPLASLLLAIVGALLAAGSNDATRLLALCAALTSALIALVTLVPIRTSGFHSDGARWLMLRRGGRDAERWAALSTLGALAMHAVPPREWPAATLAHASTLADDSYDGTLLHQMLHGAALFRGDHGAAARHISEMRVGSARMPLAVQQLFALDSAWWAAVVEGDPQRARADYELGKRAAFASARSKQRVEAAVLLAEGRRDEARALVLQLHRDLRRAAGVERLETPYVETLQARLGDPSVRAEGPTPVA